MSGLLIASLSTLAGIATAGVVWYLWGLTENVVVLRRRLVASARLRKQKADSDDATDESVEASN